MIGSGGDVDVVVVDEDGEVRLVLSATLAVIIDCVKNNGLPPSYSLPFHYFNRKYETIYIYDVIPL